MAAWNGRSLGSKFSAHDPATPKLPAASGVVRTHGDALLLAVAGGLPAFVLFATFCGILPVGLAVDGFSLVRFSYFCLAVTNWVVLPALAWLLGALPFLRESSPLTTRSTT
jgi:hypothetical protein